MMYLLLVSSNSNRVWKKRSFSAARTGWLQIEAMKKFR
jgi:hypothetical protein